MFRKTIRERRFSPNDRAKHAWLAICCIALAVLGRPCTARAGDWEPGPDPKYTGDVTTQTDVELPKDRARKTIGIGEKVTCSIDPAKFADVDCKTENGKVVNGNDELGKVVWSTDGQLLPLKDATGNSATVEARQDKAGPGTATAEISDAGKLAQDNKTVKKSAAFDVVVPASLSIVKVLDDGGVDKGNVEIYAGGAFDYLIAPTTVNFVNATIYEDVDVTRWTWPDGTKDDNNVPAGGSTVKFDIQTIDLQDGNGWTWNVLIDHVASPMRPIGRLNAQAFTIGDKASPLGTHIYWLGSDQKKNEFAVTVMSWVFNADGSGHATVAIGTSSKSTGQMGAFK